MQHKFTVGPHTCLSELGECAERQLPLIDSHVERTRFKLPQACACGARGIVILEAPRFRQSEGAHPHPTVVAIEGPFRLVSQTELVCVDCEDLANSPDRITGA